MEEKIMPFSTTKAAEILNYMFSKTSTSLSAPDNIYIGLSTNDPEADGGAFNELSGNNYARVLVSKKGAAYPDYISSTSGRTIVNSKQIVFNKASAKWETAMGFGLFTAATGGSPFYYAKLDSDVTVDGGAVALFDPNTLSIGFATTDA